MILKALYDYYNRCSDLPQKGLELKEIGYIIVIDEDGTFVNIENHTSENNNYQIRVIQAVKRSGKKYVANYFYDKYEYVVGGKGESAKKHKKFRELVSTFNSLLPNNISINAIHKFYQKHSNVEDIITTHNLFDKLKKDKKQISFRLRGASFVAAEDEELTTYVLNNKNPDIEKGTCLITGLNSTIARLHTSIKLSKDSGPLVSFQKDQGYDSYGKLQGYNAPISEDAEFAYTTALNHLLRFDSRNKFYIGDRTFLFWASNNSNVGKQVEGCIWEMFGHSDSDNDNPNRGIGKVRKVFESIYSGSLKTSIDDKFYILGVAPNSVRIAVTYWAEIPLRNFAKRIKRHFDDMDIADTRKEKKPYMGLNAILASVTLEGKINGKDSRLTPNLPEAVAKSIFQGIRYPYTLYTSCIRRIRAEQQVYITRAAILKAYLNRLINNEQKIQNMLDSENKNPGYLCGRLFAVLEKTQEEANNLHTIRERYLNSASSTPALVFPTILKLSSHHSEKLNTGRRFWFDKLKREIVEKISSTGFPNRLDIEDQGRFFVGYYHQRQQFFKKTESNNEED